MCLQVVSRRSEKKLTTRVAARPTKYFLRDIMAEAV